MPRKSRKQPGASGGAYTNRTDLAAPTQAVAAPSGLAYGEKQAMEQSQSAAPLPGDPFAAALQAAQATPFQPTPLTAPDQQPLVPIQHGLSTGPGGGPEVLQKLGTGKTADTLARIAADTGNRTLEAMAERARAYGI